MFVVLKPLRAALVAEFAGLLAVLVLPVPVLAPLPFPTQGAEPQRPMRMVGRWVRSTS